MSHICRAKINLKNVNKKMLKEVVKFVAKKHDGMTVSTVMDYFTHETQVDIGFVAPEFRRGIGIKFDTDGRIEFLYDDYGYGVVVEKLKNEIIQTYTAQATATALKILGYKVEAEEHPGGIILTGVSQ